MDGQINGAPIKPPVVTNPILIDTLRKVLAMAERGEVIDGVFIGLGETNYMHASCVQRTDQISRIIGELATINTSLQHLLLEQRAAEIQRMRPAVLVPGRDVPPVPPMPPRRFNS